MKTRECWMTLLTFLERCQQAVRYPTLPHCEQTQRDGRLLERFQTRYSIEYQSLKLRSFQSRLNRWKDARIYLKTRISIASGRVNLEIDSSRGHKTVLIRTCGISRLQCLAMLQLRLRAYLSLICQLEDYTTNFSRLRNDGLSRRIA